MINIKQYIKPNELIEFLISNGISVSNKEDTLNKLKKYSYYSIVNSYKDVFKTSNNKYINNVSFDEIYSLYEFDKNLRFIFLKFILEIETIIKSLISELISSKYGIENYLKLENFDESFDISIIKSLIDKIYEKINKQIGKHEAITHYNNKYGFIPPFVLTKILTLGELSKLYTILKQSDRQIISKEFKISDKLLKQIMKNITMTRNICAHNDRLFSFHSKFFLTFKEIDKNYNNKNKSTNLYMIMRCIQVLLDDKKKKEFEDEIKTEIKNLEIKIKSVDINDILYLMGFYNE